MSGMGISKKNTKKPTRYELQFVFVSLKAWLRVSDFWSSVGLFGIFFQEAHAAWTLDYLYFIYITQIVYT